MNLTNRRTFLHQSLRAAAVVVAAPRMVAAAPAAGDSVVPQPFPPAAWQKHGITLDATEDWEGGEVQNFTSPAEPLDGDRWRFWYSPCGKKYTIAYAEGVPGSLLKKFPAQCTPGEPGEDAALYETVRAVGMELCPQLGITIPVIGQK